MYISIQKEIAASLCQGSMLSLNYPQLPQQVIKRKLIQYWNFWGLADQVHTYAPEKYPHSRGVSQCPDQKVHSVASAASSVHSRSQGHFRLRGRKIDSRFHFLLEEWQGHIAKEHVGWKRLLWPPLEHTLPQSGIWLCVHSEIGWSGKALWDSEVTSEQRPKGEGSKLCTYLRQKHSKLK